MSSGIYSNVQPGMLGLEMSLHRPIPTPNPQNPHLMPPQPMMPYAGDYHHPQTQQKQPHPSSAKSKNQALTLSDDEEPGFATENSADDGKRKISPWQRMKWTDNMVRLLIMVVFYIGDEVGTEAVVEQGGKKKGGGGALQKKGKWKSVSRAMMERGFYVSPQQCEDKFNDLNKRYKRVNDILGKGTSCRVVENQSLLDTMDHLSPKLKEEVKKLLNSKHLFFREMCAYHNSCGHGGGGSGGVHHLPPEASQAQLQSQQQRCLHSTETAPVNRGEIHEGAKWAKETSVEEDDYEDNDDEEEDDEEEDEDDDEVIGGGGGSRVHEDEINETDDRSCMSRKRMKKVQELDAELMNMLQDARKSPFEKRQWMKAKLMRLEEQRVGIQSQCYELEKQRLKWLRFSSKKEREMEREKLTNERVKLENERMVLLIRRKELDLLEHHQQQQHLITNRKSDPSSITG